MAALTFSSLPNFAGAMPDPEVTATHGEKDQFIQNILDIPTGLVTADDSISPHGKAAKSCCGSCASGGHCEGEGMLMPHPLLLAGAALGAYWLLGR